MKFLIINTDYPVFLQWLYAQYPGLEHQAYEKQMRLRNESLFGVADFYSNNLRKLGHEAWDIHVNNEFMQRAWAQGHSTRVGGPVITDRLLRVIFDVGRRIAIKAPARYLKPIFRLVAGSLYNLQSWFYDTMIAQVEHYKPDVLLNLNIGSISSRFLKELKPYVRLLVGQIASPLPDSKYFRGYDLIISSLPNFVEHFRRLGIPSELHKLAFESSVVSKLETPDKKIPVSFVGSLSLHHETRIQLLEHLCSRLDIRVWGQGIEDLPKDSLVRRHYVGQAWGTEMYQILGSSKITVNHHINISGSYANNMRLFEATGVGAMLVTDWKKNLHEIFEPGKEVLAYRTPEECSEMIEYYLEHNDERETVAHAGQVRTLREHTYYQRMQELVEIIRKYL